MNASKILLAEDDLFLRDIYTETLIDGGFDVTVAVDGEEALTQMRIGGWDIVLLDVVMPKMTGIEVMKIVKDFTTPPAKHILFLTNSDETHDLDEVLPLTSGYIMKSAFTPDKLIEKIKGYLV